MATNFSVSTTQDSDEVQEMYCEECENNEDKYTPADGFCVDCVEYKCVDCLKYHRRHLKTHRLEDKDSMPQDFYFEKCSVHPKELVKFYCSGCEKVACQECKTNDHKNCAKIDHLPTLVKDIQQSTELKDLKKYLDKISKDIELTEKQLEAKTELIDSQEAKAKATIKDHKDQLIETYRQQKKEIIDNFDKKMEETIAKLKKERKELVEELAKKETMFEVKINGAEMDILKAVENSNADFKKLKEKHLTLVDDLKNLSADLVQGQALGQNCKLYLKMKLTKKHSENLFQNIQQLQNNYIHRYNVEPKLESKPTIQQLEATTTFFSYEEIHKSTIQRYAIFNSDINYKFKNFSSLCLLTESSLLATDYCNDFLVTFKITEINTKCYNTIKMPSPPWAITKVADNKAAVTFLGKQKISLITFSDSMNVINTKDIRVRGECRGIAYSNNNLIVSYEEPAKVQLLDMSGQVIKTLDKDSNGMSLFTKPWYLAASPDNTTIYVSDWDRHTVTSMTFDGKVKAIYKDDQLTQPFQLTVDESGAVYVCGLWSDNVHQLSSDLTKVKILLHASHGMDRPVSVAYSQYNNRLYVGMGHSNIKVFDLTLI